MTARELGFSYLVALIVNEIGAGDPDGEVLSERMTDGLEWWFYGQSNYSPEDVASMALDGAEVRS